MHANYDVSSVLSKINSWSVPFSEKPRNDRKYCALSVQQAQQGRVCTASMSPLQLSRYCGLCFYPEPPGADRSSAMVRFAEASEGTAVSNDKKRSLHS